MQGWSQQILILVLIFGFSFLSWLFGKLREQAEIKRVRQERTRKREEALRTGRGVTELDGDRSKAREQGPTTDELAARRQAQLRALREQQMQRGGSQRLKKQRGPAPGGRSPASVRFPQAGSGGGQLTRGILGGAGAPVVRPASGQTPPAQNLTPQQLQRRQTFAQRRREELARLQVEQESRRGEAESKRRKDHAALTRSERTPPKGSLLRERPRIGRPMTREDWRRAIIMTEILGKPVSMREEATGPSSSGI